MTTEIKNPTGEIMKLKNVVAKCVPNEPSKACLLEPLTPNVIASVNTYHQLSHELSANWLLLNHEDCVIHWMPSKQTHTVCN